MRKKIKFCLPAIVLLAVAWIAPTVAAPPVPAVPALLLRIGPPSAELRLAVAAAGGAVVQELRSGLLASVPPSALPRLRAQGISLAIVAQPEAGEFFFLLRSALPSPLLGRRGDTRVQPLEEGIWLLQTTDPAFRDRLGPPFRLKALDLSGIYAGPPPAVVAAVADLTGAHPRSAIPDLVAEVSPARLRSDILALQDFKTRFASTPQCEAAGAFILRRFRQLGLAAENDPFTFESIHQSKNILAVIPGSVAPERMVLACAHYDSTSNDRLVFAPGADDNASGTAAILELARILAGEKFNFSIGLLCVSAEEWGLYGSAHYARQARQDGAAIIAVVNLDMIAYPGSEQRVLEVIGNRESEWLADRFIAAGQPFVGLHLAKVIDPYFAWSDHASFWDQGYAALCGIEDSDNPYYHRTSDTVDTLDLGFAAEAVRASLATVADLAQPLTIPAAPSGLRARSQVSASLFAGRKSVYLDWDAGREALAGYHVYRAEVAHGPYARLTAQPVARTSFADLLLPADRTYYYVLTAVDGQGRESNFSEEVRDDENN
jgi:hypothetical protein